MHLSYFVVCEYLQYVSPASFYEDKMLIMTYLISFSDSSETFIGTLIVIVSPHVLVRVMPESFGPERCLWHFVVLGDEYRLLKQFSLTLISAVVAVFETPRTSYRSVDSV